MKINTLNTVPLVLLFLISSACSKATTPKEEEVDPGITIDKTEIKWQNDSQIWNTFTDNTVYNWKNASYITEGWDLSLPPSARASENAFIDINSQTTQYFKNVKDITGIRLSQHFQSSWSTLEATENNYDFSSITNAIKNARANGFDGICLRFYANTYNVVGNFTTHNSAPKWIKTKYPDMYILTGTTDVDLGSRVDNYALWDPRFNALYDKLLDKFGETSIPNSDGLLGCYVCGISSSRGEEFYLPQSLIKEAETNGGLTRANFESTFKSRLDKWSEIFGNNVGKLMWVGDEANIYSTEANSINQYAINKGLGVRGGIIEVYLNKLYLPLCGTYINDNGYLSIDESNTLIANPNILYGDEAEEYYDDLAPRFGDIKMNGYRYFEAMLRLLQMRKNMVWIGGSKIDYELTTFVANELGKTVEDTPDVWAYLRQSKVYDTSTSSWHTKTVDCKNYERWLYQRDMPNGYMTVPAMPVPLDKQDWVCPPDYKFSYTARRTDIDSGNDKIAFAIDDRYINGAQKVAIKISYHDIGKVQWGIRYHTSNGELKEKYITTANSKNLRTATFIISDGVFNAQNLDSDFEIYSVNGNIAVSLVRVIKI